MTQARIHNPPKLTVVLDSAAGTISLTDRPQTTGWSGLHFYLRNGNWELALRRFKRKVQQEDIIKEVKRHSFYLKPGEKLRAKQALARKRNRKKNRREIE